MIKAARSRPQKERKRVELIAKAQSKPGKPNYGTDPPRRVRPFAMTAAGCALGIAIIAQTQLRGIAGRLLIVTLGVAGLTSGAATLSTLAYTLYGERKFCERMLNMIDWRGDETVLDVGTRRGMLAIGAAQRLTTGTAIGIETRTESDACPDSTEIAQCNAEVAGVAAKVSLCRENIGHLRFNDDSFDVILSTLSLHEVKGEAARLAACAELARVLKPGGTALIADYTATKSYVAMLSAAGLIVERSRPYLWSSLTYLRVVAATKLM